MSGFLKGKTAVITGGSRRLGKSMALARAACLKTGVSDEASVGKLSEEVLARFGGVDILVNNAGMNIRKPVHEFTLEERRRVNDANVTSVFLLCRAFVPVMKGKHHGRIVNMTSIMSHVSLPAAPPAPRRKPLCLASHAPGPSNSPPKASPSTVPVGRWGKVEEIGQLARYTCSEDAGFITGNDILIDGVWCPQ